MSGSSEGWLAATMIGLGQSFLRCMVVATLPFGVSITGSASAHAQDCTKADFEGVVDQAASTLRDFAQKNTGVFQGKLRTLKEKRGWSNDQFLKEGETYVRDDRIVAFDEQTEDLLVRLNAAGTVQGVKPDCRLLGELRKTMGALVETQRSKWSYMFGKVDAELAR
jgi:hypothetical protein